MPYMRARKLRLSSPAFPQIRHFKHADPENLRRMSAAAQKAGAQLFFRDTEEENGLPSIAFPTEESLLSFIRILNQRRRVLRI